MRMILAALAFVLITIPDAAGQVADVTPAFEEPYFGYRPEEEIVVVGRLPDYYREDRFQTEEPVSRSYDSWSGKVTYRRSLARLGPGTLVGEVNAIEPGPRESVVPEQTNRVPRLGLVFQF